MQSVRSIITDQPLIWGNLRNILESSSLLFQNEIAVVGVEKGEFPVDDYHPVFAEIPKDRRKETQQGPQRSLRKR